ncbi:hypothetical protein Taro_017148 [Colocasia esculenta]|uniref:Protein kinase domain-containing protein n=1 Tax=Colocasia esculenta TaxID=4460 RepID=A0A843UMC8_COLES|nr:hypothetical protein [Colocasia esculenta]
MMPLTPSCLLFLFFFFSPTLSAPVDQGRNASSKAAARTLAPVGSSSSPSADALALLAFKSAADPDGRLRFNDSALSPSAHCSWPGVQCSPASAGGGGWRVTRLVLEDLGLRGRLPATALGRLDQLRILSLKNNSLAGPVSDGDLANLTNLKALFLDHNRLSGGFPLTILRLRHLRTLDLSHNALSGPLPAALASDLGRLYCLRLEANRFTGAMPPFNQTSLKVFNVSGNDLSGPVPATTVLLGFDPSAFAGNPGLCGKAVRKECQYRFFFSGSPSPAPSAAAARTRSGQLKGLFLPAGNSSSTSSSPSDAQKKRRRVAAAVGFLGGAILIIGLAGYLASLRRKQRSVFVPHKISSTAMTGTAMEIYAESNNCVGDRHHSDNGSVNGYGNGEANGGGELAAAAAAAAMVSEDKVKKMGRSGSLVFCAGEAQMYSLEQLMRASAEMLGRGCVATTYKAVLSNRLIVTVKRLDAARLAATGKEAFERHMEAVGRLRHPNLVSLRAYFQAKEERLLVYDYQPNGSLFSLIHGSRSTRSKPLHWTSCLKIAEDVAQGLAYIHQASRLVHGNIKSSNILLGPDFEACLTDCCLAVLVEPTDGEGDTGYRAPEIRSSNRWLTAKSDIYAFGVLVLEILTGKAPLQHSFLVATDLPVWVRSAREDEAGEDERVTMLLDIAAACIRSSPESRPTAWQVLKMIQEVKEADMSDDGMDAAGDS